MGDRVVSVDGYFGEEAVGVYDDFFVICLADGLFFKWGGHPGTLNLFDGVEVEEYVGLVIGGDIVFEKDGPLLEVFIPVAELHVERAVDGFVVHLVVKALAGGH